MSHFNYSSTGFSPKFNHKVTRPKSAHHSFAHSTIKNPDLYIESLKSKASLHKPSSTQIIGLQSDEVFQFVEPKSLQPKEYHISLVPSGGFPSANSYFHQAYKHRSRGDFQNALTYYRQALNIDPKHLPSRINVGVCMMKLNMIEAAIENFQTAEGMHPYEPISYFNRVICHLSLGEYDQAIDGINTSLAFLSQEEMKDYVSLKALALFRAGKVADAIDVSKTKNESAKMKEDDVVKRAYNSLFPHKVNKDFLSFRRPSTNSGVRKLLSESKPNIGISKLELGKHQKVSSARTVSSLIGSTRVSTAVNTQRIKKPVRLSSANPKLTLSVPRKSFLTGTHELPCESKEALATPKSKEINTIKSVEELPTYEELLAKKKMFDTMIAESEAVINSIVPIHRKRDNIVDKEIGFFQDDLQIEATDYKEEILHNQHKKNRTAKIRRDIERDVEASKKIFYDESTLVSEILTAKISIQSLKFIQNEFEKPFEARDYSELEKMLSKLPFFAKFPGGVRVQLLKRCEFRIFQKEDYIIRQGDPGDYMFVIISGAIEIRKVSPDFGMLDITINSMYDGETFGELALLADPAGISIKRTASCLANERTLLIALAKEDYKHILLEQMQNDIIGKVDFFKKLPIFQDSEGLSLIPLASNIEPVTYKINEPLILQGEKPQGLYIIYKGRCTVYWEGYSKTPKDKGMTTNPRLRSPVPRPFFTGNYVPPTADIVSDALKIEKTIDEKLFYRTLDFSKPEDVQKASTFLGTKNIHEVAKKNSIFKEKIEFYSLKEGDYFGARGLLEGHTDNDENKGQGYETIVAEPAKFSVIAESRDVKVFILRKKHFALLTENTMQTLKTVLKNHYEIDCPKQYSNEYLRTAFKEWQSFKVALIEDIHKEKFIEKNKHGFYSKR